MRRGKGWIVALVGALVVGIAAGASGDGAASAGSGAAPSRIVGGDNNSRGAAVSADGGCVAFWSRADNLTSRRRSGFGRRVWLRNVRANRTVLVSRQSSVDGGAPAGGDDVAISGNGRFVAFRSGADNLSRGDRGALSNLFVRDLKTKRTTLVSRQSASAGGAAANGFSDTGSLSASGRYVAFWSWARNLSEADENDSPDVFVRDLSTKTTSLVSRQSAADGGAGGTLPSYGGSISADGRYVTFFSYADNLTDADPGGGADVFVRDLKTKQTALVSRQSAVDGGAAANGFSYSGGVSADGRYVAFVSFADNLSDSDGDGTEDVFVRDMQTSETILVSRQSAADGGAAGNGDSNRPVVSADGRYVAFASRADNLSSADDDRARDIFVRDLQTNETILVSRRSTAEGGAGGDSDSNVPSISADGRYVAFWSYADNLSDADRDRDKYGSATIDVFLRDLRTNTTTLVSRADSGRRSPACSGGLVADRFR